MTHVNRISTTELAETYYLDLSASYARGKLKLPSDLPAEDAFRAALDAGVRIFRFKRNASLPRVQRVLGILRGLAPSSLLDVGSGRGTFLWPFLDENIEIPVVA